MTTNTYAVHVETTRRDLTPDEAEQIVDELDEWHPAVGTSPRGWVDVQMTVPAESLEGAIRVGVALARQFLDAEPLAVAAMTDAEFDARLGAPAMMPQLIGVTQAAEALGVTRQRVLQMVDEGKLSSTRVGNAIAIPLDEVEHRITTHADDESAEGNR